MSFIICRTISFAVLFFVTINLPVLAQTAQVRGRVISAETSEPIRGARVFLAETTLGAVTTSDGTFTLRNIPSGTYQLVTSSLGYKAHKESLTLLPKTDRTLTIQLLSSPVQLGNVVVTANRESASVCSEYIERLIPILLGTTPNGKRATLLNAEVIRCILGKDDNGERVVRFEADEPLVIENKTLGYRIRYYMENVGFYLRLRADGGGSEWYIGVMEFEELPARDSNEIKRWQQQREETYKGSFRHFLHCLIDGTWRNAGFEITSIDYPDTYLRGKGSGVRARVGNIPLQSISTLTKRLSLPGAIEVVAQKGKPAELEFVNYAQSTIFAKSHQRSSLLLPQSLTVDVQTQGVLKRPTDITIYGYWGWQRLADELPLNYSPAQILMSSAKQNTLDTATPRPYNLNNSDNADSIRTRTLLSSALQAYKQKNFLSAKYLLDTLLSIAPNQAEAYFYRGLAQLNLNAKKLGCADCIIAQFLGYPEAEQAVQRFCIQAKTVENDSLKTYRTENVVVEGQTLQSKEAWSNLRALAPHIRLAALQLGAITQRKATTVIDPSSVDTFASREKEMALTEYDCQASRIKTSSASRLSLQCIGKLVKEQAYETHDKELQAIARRIEALIRDIHHAEPTNRTTLIVYLRSEFAAFLALML